VPVQGRVVNAERASFDSKLRVFLPIVFRF
jgi:hypothetical protein